MACVPINLLMLAWTIKNAPTKTATFFRYYTTYCALFLYFNSLNLLFRSCHDWIHRCLLQNVLLRKDRGLFLFTVFFIIWFSKIYMSRRDRVLKLPQLIYFSIFTYEISIIFSQIVRTHWLRFIFWIVTLSIVSSDTICKTFCLWSMGISFSSMRCWDGEIVCIANKIAKFMFPCVSITGLIAVLVLTPCVELLFAHFDSAIDLLLILSIIITVGIGNLHALLIICLFCFWKDLFPKIRRPLQIQSTFFLLKPRKTWSDLVSPQHIFLS